jgi:hypothetical protein
MQSMMNTEDEQATHSTDELSLHQPSTLSCKKINLGATPPPPLYKNQKSQTSKHFRAQHIYKKKHKTITIF